MKWLDTMVEDSARALARRISRRSLLGSFGAMLVGTAAFPLLPVARSAEPKKSAAGTADDPGDPSTCQYWRYCAIDGFLCGCCGGTKSSCPPGTEMSAVAWIGTCHNSADGKDYIVSYNDCCGKAGCGRCLCTRNEKDTPMYQPIRSNDYNWCAASSAANIPYHCSTARIIGTAD